MKTKMPAIMVMIALLKRYVQRYVLIKVLIYTDFRERRACLRERVTRLLVSVKFAVVKTCPVFGIIIGGSGILPRLAGFLGVNQGVKK
ncbi:hypothetical protein [Methanoculleus sp.]|uniref:hypothetical protein n=1 Tax=Methanoculleus sp. TaxID=90427 RepID=UPI0025D56D0B|nr:hypothetical protein [Methanoculleus sp.]